MAKIRLEDRESWPKIGTTWQHKNGNRYRVILFSNVETARQEEYPTTIIYQNVHTQAVYSRRLMDWERSMTQYEEQW